MSNISIIGSKDGPAVDERELDGHLDGYITGKGLGSGPFIPTAQKGVAFGVAPLDAGTRVPQTNLPAHLDTAALTATFVPKWKATTAYLAGDKVLNPSGDVVSAKVNFTSAATYDATNWDLSANVTGKLDKTEAASSYGRSAFPSSRLVLAGDSLTDYEDASAATGSQWSPRGPWTWALIYLGQRLDVVNNAGIAGNTSTQLLARYDTDVIAYTPGVVSLLIGTNDPASAIPLATTKANITAMLDKNRAAGAITVLRTIPPQDADDTTKKNFRIQLNNWIKTQTSRKDVIVVDNMPSLTDPATGNYASGLSYDGIHFGAAGAQLAGKKIADALTPIIPAWERLPSSAFDPDNALTNGWMVGDGASYHEATGWTFSGTGLVLSKVNRTDGVQGQWQQIVTTAAESTQKLNRTITLGTVLNVGDTVQCFTEFETDAASWGSVSQFHIVAIAKNVGTPTWYAYSMLSQSTDHWPSATFRLTNGVFATPKFVIPAGSTVIEFRLVFNGIGTVRWGRSVVKKA